MNHVERIHFQAPFVPALGVAAFEVVKRDHGGFEWTFRLMRVFQG